MEPYIVTLTSKGQLTLPAPVRRELGLRKGNKLFLVLDSDEIRLKKIQGKSIPIFSEKSTFLELMGSFEGPPDLADSHDKYLGES